MNTVLDIHANLPILIVLVAIAAIIYLAVRWMQRKSYDRNSSLLMAVFRMLLDIQMLLGLIYFVWNGIDSGDWPAERFAHLAVMFVVVAIGYLPKRWQTAPDGVRFRNDLLVLVSALVLGFVGASIVFD